MPRLLTPSTDRVTPRWYALKPHPEQYRLWHSDARFRVVPAGRRSGKTELAKRFLCKRSFHFKKSINGVPVTDGCFVFAAPTYRQAKNIYWRDAKALVPRWAQRKKASETELTIYLDNGVDIVVVGMDKPERIEGRPLDGIVLDEYANMKETAWGENVRPMLDEAGREGWAWLIGVPEGRNHYYKKYKQAMKLPDWDVFHWFSRDILSAAAIRAAREELDPLTFQQEYEGSFITFEGRAYYGFTIETHAVEEVREYYDRRRPLVFTLDFNVAPGTAGVVQEHYYEGADRHVCGEEPVSMCMGEVFIPRGSNTRMVVRKLVMDWGKHEGDVYFYGDATGGNKHSSSDAGSDWDLVRQEVKQAERMGRVKWNRVYYRNSFEHFQGVGRNQNPPERARVNSVNARFLNAADVKRMLVDPVTCPHMVEDFDGVRTVEGGSGEIDKNYDPMLTHISDGVGYYVVHQHPVKLRATGKVITLS